MTDPGLPRLADAEFLRAIADEWMANADIETSLLSDANQMNAIADQLERVAGMLDALVTEELNEWCCGECYDAWLSDNTADRPAARMVHLYVGGCGAQYLRRHVPPPRKDTRQMKSLEENEQ